MKKLLKNQSASKRTAAIPDSVEVACVHATVHKSLGDGERFEMSWTIDFDGMTQEQILEAAAEHFIIKIRRTFAKIDKPKDAEWDCVTFKAQDFLTMRISKADKLAATLATFSDEDLKALGYLRS